MSVVCRLKLSFANGPSNVSVCKMASRFPPVCKLSPSLQTALVRKLGPTCMLCGGRRRRTAWSSTHVMCGAAGRRTADTRAILVARRAPAGFGPVLRQREALGGAREQPVGPERAPPQQRRRTARQRRRVGHALGPLVGPEHPGAGSRQTIQESVGHVAPARVGGDTEEASAAIARRSSPARAADAERC